MRRWGRMSMGWGGVLAVTLLLPGGSLLLAWTLYRRFFPKARDVES